MQVRLFVLAAVLIGACNKASEPVSPPRAVASTADQDALWDLAPADTILGVVASSRAIGSLESAALSVKKLFAAAPELAPASAKLDAALVDVLGTTNVRLADVGLAPSKGGAYFQSVSAGWIRILPVVDRDKFLAVVKGTKGTDVDTLADATCKTVKGFYICAYSADAFAHLGNSGVKDKLKLAGARGDIEVIAAIPSRSGQPVPGELAAVAQLDHGSVIVRAAVRGGLPSEAMRLFLATDRPQVAANKVAGFAIVNLVPMIAGAKLPPLPIVPGVTLDELANNVAGAMTVTVEPGSMLFDIRVPMKDPALVQRLVSQCAAVPFAFLFSPKVENGVCKLHEPRFAFEIDVWVEGNELRMGKNGALPTSHPLPSNPIANELAGGGWAIAMFGRGSLLGEGKFPPLPLGDNLAQQRMVLRAWSLINEVGLGVRTEGDTMRALFAVRTAWSNPDDVVAKLSSLDIEPVIQGKSSPAAKAIADASPSSPFAMDYKGGVGGVMIPTAAVGIIAAVAIPALLDFTKKSKRPEAILNLKRLESELEIAYTEHGAFPKGKAPLTPPRSCCEGAKGKCSDRAAWQSPIWQSLGFSIDEPHLFQYSYESDGKAFTAKAVGDLDCDTNQVEWVLTGGVDAQGNVTTTLTEPQQNAD